MLIPALPLRPAPAPGKCGLAVWSSCLFSTAYLWIPTQEDGLPLSALADRAAPYECSCAPGRVPPQRPGRSFHVDSRVCGSAMGLTCPFRCWWTFGLLAVSAAADGAESAPSYPARVSRRPTCRSGMAGLTGLCSFR